MNSKQLIEQVNKCRQNHWQNSDLMNKTERRLEIIADHYNTCDECADLFDVSGYESETLIDFIRESNFENTSLSDWICIYNEYKYVTVGDLRNIGENIELGDERLDDDEEVRLVSVATTKDGEILVQVDVKDSYDTWDAHCDFDITLGMEDKEFFDINSGEPFETYSGYGIVLTKDEWKQF